MYIYEISVIVVRQICGMAELKSCALIATDYLCHKYARNLLIALLEANTRISITLQCY